jgi:hypothetical protein
MSSNRELYLGCRHKRHAGVCSRALCEFFRCEDVGVDVELSWQREVGIFDVVVLVPMDVGNGW